MLVNDKQNHEEIKLQRIIPGFPHPKLKGKKKYNNELVKLIEDSRTRDQINILQKKKSLNRNIAIFKSGQVQYGVAIDDNSYLNYNDYKMKAIAAISNIARQLACAGIRPEVCSGFLKISKDNQKEKNSFLKGIHDVGKSLNLNIDHLSFEISEDLPYGKFIAAGTYTRNELLPNTFGSKDLFISMLGSHRGELGGSRYLHLLNQENKGNRPVVDLLMESRLQEAVLTGIHGGLIQSARAIGRGGVALAIAKSFEKKSNLGARIHFSRKLKTEELLFGETQGLALVTIKENDLMEFERICMTIGVPATTIGRVTGDGFYTFNKSIKLPVKELN
jgi:phosphoribosylformylglycinamidine synthase